MAFTARDGTTRTALSEINMVPFIDIVLVLLIIFMVTAPVIQSGVEVHVPKTQFVREISEVRLIISITQNETIYLQNDPVNINELVDKIKERKPDEKNISVYVRADTDAHVGALLRIMDKLKSAGIENVSMVTEPLERSATPGKSSK
jgi:biopolymer transport protein TolR